MSSSYASLMKTLNAPEGSETHERLIKLQELEEIRKKREAMRQQRMAGNSVDDGTSSIRARRYRTANQDYTGGLSSLSSRRGLSRTGSESSEDIFGLSSMRDYGGARPKFAGTTSSSMDQEEDLSNMFSNITESIIGRSRSGSSDSGSSYSYSRNRFGQGNSTYGQIYERPYYSSERTTDYQRPYFSRSVSDTTTVEYDPDERTRRWRERKMARERERQQKLASEEQNFDYISYTTTDENQNQQNEEEGKEVHNEHHEVNLDYEENEEPKHFIERLKLGNGETNGSLHSKRGANNDYIISTIPSVPPLKRQKPEVEGDVPELIEPSDEDIVAVAKDIRATFGIQSPKSGESSANDDSKHFDFNTPNKETDVNSNGDFIFTATSSGHRSRLSSARRRSLRQNGKNLRHSNEKLSSAGREHEQVMDANCSVEHEIVEGEDDTEDEEGKVLPVSEAFNRSVWAVGNHSQGQLDHMNEFFTGDSVNGDPTIDRELDGKRVKEFLDKSNTKIPSAKIPDKQKGALSTVKSALDNLVQFDSSGSNKSNSSKETTPEREIDIRNKKDKKLTPKTTPKTSEKGKKISTQKSTKKKDVGKHKAIEKVKNSCKSSDSDNESFQTASESENSRKSSRATTPTQSNGTKASNKSKDKTDMDLTLSDKLAKLETLTQEKSRKHSFSSDTDGQKPVPSYMRSTGASSKKSRPKSPGGLRSKSPAGLVKDVRELKKFVQEHTGPDTSTPIHTPKKSEQTNGLVKSPKSKIVKDMSTQTDIKMEDTIVKLYVCMHCGKSSEHNPGSPEFEFHTDGEDVESVEKYETRSETGLKIRSLTPNQNRSSTPKSYTKNEKKASSGSRGYMRGTTSSLLKKGNEKSEKVRKSSVPDILYKPDDSANNPKSIVAQRARELEEAAKKGEQKRSGYSSRANSVDRNKHLGNERSKLAKSKSVDAMFIAHETIVTAPVEIDIEKPITDINSNDIVKQDPSSPEVKDSKPFIELKSPVREKTKSPVKEIQRSQVKELQKSLVKEVSNSVSSKPEIVSTPKSNKPPPVAPKPKKKPDKEIIEVQKCDKVKAEKETTEQPTIDTDQVFEEKVESKGQFTRLENNPFIKNDSQRVQRKNSIKSDGESVWEKSGSRSTSSVESPQRDSPMRKSQSSASGERGSLTQLNWSDSGSSESLHKSKSSHTGSRSSSLHGSFESLNKSPPQRKRTASITSTTSQNAMLNLLSPVATTRHPVTGALETDVDAAYNNDHIDTAEEHNEETVEKAHLEFAKNALNLLEFDTKKRDSSNESESGSKKENNKTIQNGHGSEVPSNVQTNTGGNKNSNKGKNKGKKGFFKGKMFKK